MAPFSSTFHPKHLSGFLVMNLKNAKEFIQALNALEPSSVGYHKLSLRVTHGLSWYPDVTYDLSLSYKQNQEKGASLILITP